MLRNIRNRSVYHLHQVIHFLEQSFLDNVLFGYFTQFRKNSYSEKIVNNQTIYQYKGKESCLVETHSFFNYIFFKLYTLATKNSF